MPLIRRRRPVLRAAAMTGGAYAVGKGAARNEAMRQDDAYHAGQQNAAASQVPPRVGLSADDTNRLAELGRLHEQGVLTDDEFSHQKARILGMG